MEVVCLWFSASFQAEKVMRTEPCLLSRVLRRRGRAIFLEDPGGKSLEESLNADLERILKNSGSLPQIGKGANLAEALLQAKYGLQKREDLPLGALLDLADPLEEDVSMKKSILKMISFLQDVHVLTVGQFQKIPISDLSSRFGPVGTLCGVRAREMRP